MTEYSEQLEAVRAQIIEEALRILRDEGMDNEVASRVYTVPQEAAEAAEDCRHRIFHEEVRHA